MIPSFRFEKRQIQARKRVGQSLGIFQQKHAAVTAIRLPRNLPRLVVSLKACSDTYDARTCTGEMAGRAVPSIRRSPH